MHSRIFQIEKEALFEEEYIDSDSIPEWFTNSVADYTSNACSREDDIDYYAKDESWYTDHTDVFRGQRYLAS